MNKITLTLTDEKGTGDWKLAVADGAAKADPNADRPAKYRLIPAQDGLYQAVALRNIYDAAGRLIVREGTRSGLLHSERALSQHGASWVWPEARVLDRAYVNSDAQVRGAATLHDSSRAEGNAVIGEYAELHDYTRVYNCAYVGGRAVVKGGASVSGSARVEGRALINSPVHVTGGSVYDSARIETQEEFTFNGNVNGSMLIKNCRGYLQINTCWGPLTVAPTSRETWEGTVGCQRFDTFADLKELAKEEGSDYELALLEGWFAMMRVAFEDWGIVKERIASSTRLDDDE